MFPNWLNKTHRFPDGWTHGPISVVRGKKVRKIEKLATLETSSKCVCRDCNSGWMSQLESEVRPLLGAMINGYKRSISAEDQLTLARWACLKAACFDADPRSNDPVASEAARSAVRGTANDLVPGRVPDRWAVWIGLYDRPGYFACHMPYAVGVGVDGEFLGQFVFTIVMNHVVIVVQGRTGGVTEPPLEQFPGGFDLASRLDGSTGTPPLVSLWPVRSQGIEWPLQQVLTPSQLATCITFQLPDSPGESEDIREKQAEILTHDEPSQCSCGAAHAKLERVSLPLPEPFDWLPGA